MAGRISKIVIVGFILWLLWGERVYRPSHRELPVNTVMLSSKEELAPLVIGQAVAIEGKVFPADAGSDDKRWKERFAYRRSITQKDEFGSSREVVKHHVRPSIRLEWKGDAVVVPGDSYKMESAPEAPDDSVLLTTEKNVGFRAGDAALALGRKTGEASITVDELAIGPLGAYLKILERENTIRVWIGYGLRVVVSLFAVSLLLRSMRGREPDLEAPSPETAGP